MSEWKKVKITFPTIKLGDFIEPIKTTVGNLEDKKIQAYGVTNKEGIVITGKEPSEDKSKYIVLENNCFAFNPYRINVGSIGLNDKNIEGCVNPAYVVFKTINGLIPKFLFFYLKSEFGNHLINWYGNRGGVRNALRYSDLCNIDIPDITKLNQTDVLKTLNTITLQTDKILSEIDKQKSYAKQLRQSVLQDAIEGKLTADWRKSHPVEKGNPDYDAEALFQKIQEEKEAKKTERPISQSIDKNKWIKTELGQITTLKIGGTPSRNVKSYWNGNISWVSSGEVANCHIDSTKEHITQAGSDNSAAKKLPIGTVLVAMIGQGKIRGQTAILKISAATNQNVCGIILPKCLLLSEYIFYYFEARYEESRGAATGGNQAALSGTKISKFIFHLPPLAEQFEIVRRVETQLEKIAQLEQQIATREELIKQLMRNILRDAFEGER